MLECEAVCTRICIMKLGEMVCLGDSQHLRSTHGTGFLLDMSFQSPVDADRGIGFVVTVFAGAVIIDNHATMVSFEIPKASIQQLSEAFKLLEAKKKELGIVDYALSQSTLEQVFLKQIRPNDRDMLRDDNEALRAVARKPMFWDYFFAYIALAIALFIPGFHHFYLGNFWRGLLYFCTANEIYAGWLLDVLEMHVLVQKSVEQFGHTKGCVSLCPCFVVPFVFCCPCCCCCCKQFKFEDQQEIQASTNATNATNVSTQNPIVVVDQQPMPYV